MTAPTPHAASTDGATGRPEPGPAPASLAARILAQARYETSTALRNAEQLVVTVVLPLLALIALHVTGMLETETTAGIDRAVPGVLALAVVSSAFTANAIATGFERRYDVLAALATTPLGVAGLILGKAVSVVVIVLGQCVLIGAVGLALGWRPEVQGLPAALLMLALGAVVFTAMGLLLAGTARPEATLAAANLLWVLFGAVGGTVFPPAWPPLGLLPPGALGEGLRAALVEGSLDVSALLTLIAWGAALVAAALAWFRWRP